MKLRFDASPALAHGSSYLWIDPPWRFWQGSTLWLSSEDFCELDWEAFFTTFAPIDQSRLCGLEWNSRGALSLQFERGFRLSLPRCVYPEAEDDGYQHWYVGLSSVPEDHREFQRRLGRSI